MSAFSFDFGTPFGGRSFLPAPGGQRTVSVGNQGSGNIGTQSQTKSGSFIDLVRDLAGISRDIYQTKQQGDLIGQQINAGQYPSLARDDRGNLTPAAVASALGISTTTLAIVAAIVVLFLLMRK